MCDTSEFEFIETQTNVTLNNEEAPQIGEQTKYRCLHHRFAY